MNARPVSFFGQMLRRYRASANLSQEELAERASLSARAISDLERGVKRAPRKDTVELLADALALSAQKRALFVATARPAHAPVPMSQALHLVSCELTAPLTPMIGRERELLAVSRLLARPDARLITFTGPGGVGKTRFALALAEEIADEFEDGIYLASLASIRDAALVAPAIARLLGLSEEPGVASIEQVKIHLRERQVMLILDNFEHLMSFASDVSDLLTACPRLRMIITSRQPLRVRGEQEAPIVPLQVEAATRLFLDRVRAAHLFEDSWAEDYRVAREICVRLDCLPLALELAAVRARALPLPALRQRLDSALTLLTVGWRDLPERQQTLRETIAWSVDLLNERERQVFRRLAVFSGGCSFEAAQAVCEEDSVRGEFETATLFDNLAALAEKSLLQIDAADAHAPRFTMLETIREYAAESLRTSGEEPRTRIRHAEYYAALDEQAKPDSDLDALDQRLQRDMDNVRAAMTLAIQTPLLHQGFQLATSFARLWYMRGYANEGEAWLRKLLELDAASEQRVAPALRLEALYGASRFAMDRRDYTRAQALALESITITSQLASASGLANALATLGHVAEADERYTDALTYFEQSLHCARQAKDINAIGRAQSSLGNLARARGEYTQAIIYLNESLTTARQLNMSWGIVNGLTSLGHVYCEQGDYVCAAKCYRESLEMCQAMPNEAAVAWLLEGVVVVVAARGDLVLAAQICSAIALLRHESAASSAPQGWPAYALAVAATYGALGLSVWQRETTTDKVLSVTGAISAALAALGAFG